MNKSDVEQIMISVKSGKEEALSIKIYKNGIIARRGSGGLPGVKISGMSFTENSLYFDKLMQSVSQQILDDGINHEEKILSGSLEYIAAFYGVSKNEDHGERAEWAESTVIRFFMDEGTTFRHNLLGFVDGLAIEAMRLTDSWYFDIVMLALENRKSSELPEQTIVSATDKEEDLEKDFQNYFQQVNKKELPVFTKDKTYADGEGNVSHLSFESDEASLTYKFDPVVQF